MDENERSGPGPASPQQSFGQAPGGDGSFGTAPTTPGTSPAPNPAPKPAPQGGRNVALLMGGIVVALAVLAAIVGFAMR
jgi:hypothetical protein